MGDRVGGYTKIITVTPTIDTNAYASGDLVGGKITIASAGRQGSTLLPSSGVIEHVVITDLAKQDVNLDVVFFDVDPTNTTFTDNAAFDVDDTDLLTIIGVASVATWKDFNDNSVGIATNLGILYNSGTVRDLFAAIVSRGAPTYGTTSDLTVRVGVLMD